MMTHNNDWRLARRSSANPGQQDSAAPRHVLDVQLVRTLLRVNPALRLGRTTMRVKRDMESAVQSTAPTGGRDDSLRRSTPLMLRDAIDAFLASKEQAWRQCDAQIEASRRQIDQLQRQQQAEARQAIVDFLRLLDREALGDHGTACMHAHQQFLNALHTSAADVLRAAGVPK